LYRKGGYCSGVARPRPARGLQLSCAFSIISSLLSIVVLPDLGGGGISFRGERHRGGRWVPTVWVIADSRDWISATKYKNVWGCAVIDNLNVARRFEKKKMQSPFSDLCIFILGRAILFRITDRTPIGAVRMNRGIRFLAARNAADLYIKGMALFGCAFENGATPEPCEMFCCPAEFSFRRSPGTLSIASFKVLRARRCGILFFFAMQPDSVALWRS